MKNVVFAVCILVCIISLTQSRPSYYYSNKDSSGYHAPYDFIDYNNNGDSACSPLCSSSTTVIQTNNNYTQVNSGQCNNIPDFFSQQNQLPGLDFGSCCSFYQSCAQTCGNTKEFCDQQFYGCIWSQCGNNYRVRPADRIICRSYATCFASWTVSNMTCQQFNFYQSQACVCVPTGNVVPLPSFSPAPGNPSVSSSPFTSFSSSPVPSSASSTPFTSLSSSPFTSLSSSPIPSASVSSSAGASFSSSPAPLGKRQAIDSNSTTESASFESSSQDVSTPNNNNNAYSNGNYISRPVPGWSSIYSQCPPTIGNYINVMSDQEMDDISMWNSGSSLKMWWDLF